MTEQTQDRTKRERSPAYPGISLGQAIDRAQVLYDQERRNAAPVTTVVRHWGFSNPSNGAATVALSALEKFGLIAVTGTGSNRKVRLTDLALTILLNPDKTEVAHSIREAALNPPIHRLLWNEYQGDLPSDDTLRYELIVGKRFSERGADNFIGQFRATIAFAKLDPLDSVAAPDNEPSEPAAPVSEPGRTDLGRVFKEPGYRPKEAGVLTIPVPLAGAEPVTIEGKFPITEAAWGQLMAVLTAMKPGLVKDEVPDTWQLEDGPPEPD